MKLIMSGLDYCRAPLALRERLAFSRAQALDALCWLKAQPGVHGCVLLSTCNRTELYLTYAFDEPWRLLCSAAHVDAGEFEPYFITNTGEDAARHLIEVACGLHSQILGEDQIITQVRAAMDLAQQAQASDAELSALFRRAVTAGKRAKTQILVCRATPSMGTRCCEVLRQELGGLAGKRILVIGNGQMGRLAAGLLQRAGARVSVTLRTYRHGQTVVPAGCEAVPYENRVAALNGMDALVSATASPHYTITLAQLQTAAQPPRVAVDLAVPRDLEPACAQILRCYDMDALGAGGEESSQVLAALHAVADEELEKFLQWRRHRSFPARPKRFPLFVDLTGKTVVLVGGGTIAARRIAALRQFGCRIVVVSPALSCSADGLVWVQRPYRDGDLEGAFLAVAATNDRAVNKAVGEEANRRGIFVSVADCEAACSFYFPAICAGEDLIAGIVSTGKDHHKTACAAREVRRVLEELE